MKKGGREGRKTGRNSRKRVVSRSELARKKPSPRSFPVSDASCVPICLYIPIDPRPAPSSLCHPTVVPLFSTALSTSSSLQARSISYSYPSLHEVSSLVARAITLRVIYLAYLYARLIEKSASVKCCSSFLFHSVFSSLLLFSPLRPSASSPFFFSTPSTRVSAVFSLCSGLTTFNRFSLTEPRYSRIAIFFNRERSRASRCRLV